VWDATNKFLELLLAHLTDDETSDKLFNIWLYPMMNENLKLAYDKLNELLEVYKDHPMTTNSNFIKNSQKSWQKNNREEFENRVKQEFTPDKRMSLNELTYILATMGPNTDLDMDLVAAEEAFDNMNAFYEVRDLFNMFADSPLLMTKLTCSRWQ
jgi:hypothetical protein